MLIVDKYGNQREYDGGILPDGFSVKVPMTFMDSAQRAVAKRFTRTLHDGRGNAVGHRPGFIYGTDSDDARARAYADANREAENAWKTPPVTPPPASAFVIDRLRAGDSCTVGGRTGRLVQRDGGLVCELDEQHDARMDDRERALREVALRDENAWRNAK
jgi:hypothetical protein